MLQIKTPEIYVSEPRGISHTGRLVKRYSDKILIIWSETAKKVTEAAIRKSLEDYGIQYEGAVYNGYPTFVKASLYARIAVTNQVTAILAVGGGRVIDTAKAAADLAEIPVITVPTIAATCAPWAALSVLYTKEGDFEQFRVNQHAPNVVIADTDILAAAPIRYLRAGIVDTLAKWYETSAGLNGKDDSFTSLSSVYEAKLAFEYLNEKALGVVSNAERGNVDEDTVKTIDAIFYLAGNVGSFVGEKAHSGFAHPFYHSSRCVESSRGVLHGELVAYGLLVQAVLEEKSKEEISSMIRQFEALSVAFTLEEIGFAENAEEKLLAVANRIVKEFPTTVKLCEQSPEQQIVKAAFQADAYVREFRKGA